MNSSPKNIYILVRTYSWIIIPLTLRLETGTSVHPGHLSLGIAKHWRCIALVNFPASIFVWYVCNHLVLVKCLFLAVWGKWRNKVIIQLEWSLLLFRLLIQLQDLATVYTNRIRWTKCPLSWVCARIHLGLSPHLQRWQFLSVFLLFFLLFLHLQWSFVLILVSIIWFVVVRFGLILGSIFQCVLMSNF